jgi:hypothetical protein
MSRNKHERNGGENYHAYEHRISQEKRKKTGATYPL